MFGIIGWMIYGVIVGSLAKLLHSGKDPTGCLPTILIGVAGSFIGGGINYVLGMGSTGFSPSGMIMGVIGGIIACWLYSKYLVTPAKEE